MRALLFLLAASGCFNPSPPAGVPCGDNDVCPAGQACIAGVCAGVATDDANLGPDVISTDAPAGCEAWAAKHINPCAIPAPMGDLNLTGALSGYSLDTGNGVLKGKMNTQVPVATMVMTQTGGPEVLVVSVNNFTMESSATLDLNGSRAVLFAVWGTATIAGDIDGAASYSIPGPGGNSAASTPTGCGSPPTGDFGATGTPATGGGGGGLQGAGGRGGNNGGLPGTPIPIPTVIQGGCAGGSGGAGTGTTGTRGAGGGAVQITARMSIEISMDSTIHVGGGGGSFGRLAYGAGGGGGAGGFIGLDAPVVTIAGVLAANGGGGGGGASDVAGGSSGANARPDGIAALGGPGATATNVGACIRGGSGAAGGTLTGASPGVSGCGGGGGGGGAGYILVWSPMLAVTGTVSPPVLAGP